MPRSSAADTQIERVLVGKIVIDQPFAHAVLANSVRRDFGIARRAELRNCRAHNPGNGALCFFAFYGIFQYRINRSVYYYNNRPIGQYYEKIFLICSNDF